MLNTDPEVLRFISELEFVQSLANPEYLHCKIFFFYIKIFYLDLSNAGYFQKPAFMNYLRYLEYWRQPEYILHLIYPQCLRVLECLKDPLFVNSLSCYDAITAIKVQQGNSWIGQRR